MIKIILILLLFFFRTNSAEVKIVNQNKELEELIICNIKKILQEDFGFNSHYKQEGPLEVLSNKVWKIIQESDLYKELQKNSDQITGIEIQLQQCIRSQAQFYLKRLSMPA